MSETPASGPQSSVGPDATLISSPKVEVPTHSSLGPQERTSAGETKPVGSVSAVVSVGSQLGPYQLLDKLGEGGMGAVFKARHVKLGRLVALKVLAPHVPSRPDALSRFEREMKAVGTLSHPNVVQALDAGDFGGVHYLSMEYVEGQDLQELARAQGPMSIVIACEAIRQAALGLGAAHKLGLVHRDIKPSNLFVTKQTGQIKILDMGLALLSEEQTPAALTSTGQCFGTPDYMAPEQWEDAHTCDARADLYALGCTLFLLLVGRTPYGGDGYRTVPRKMMGHVRDPIPNLIALRPEVPAELDAIYRKLMAKEPGDRFASADQLAEALAPFTRQSSPHAPREESRTTSDLPSHSGPVVSRSETATLGEAPAVPLAATSTWRPHSESPSSFQSGTVPSRTGERKRLLAFGGAAALAILGVIVIIASNKDGTKKDGTETKNDGSGTSKFDLTREQSPSSVARPSALAPQPSSWHSWPADAPPPAIAPFGAEQAQQHQVAWARHLGAPVEYTNSLGMRLHLIPPGEFTMGSPPSEIEEALWHMGDNKFWQDVAKSAGPQHMVILTQPIYLGIHEVTQGEYEKVTGQNPSYVAPPVAGKESVTGVDTTSRPVDIVSWNDAAEFCRKLSLKEQFKPFYFRAGETITPLDGTGYRLPTEAEWEFACRAGTTTKFWIGDKNDHLLQAGWFRVNSDNRAHVVGELMANPFGLHDSHGNVLEWCQDWWGGRYDEKFLEKPTVDPQGASASESSRRVIRGGAWSLSESHCRSSGRDAVNPKDHPAGVGFRVSLTVDAVRQALKVTGPAIPSGPAAR